MNSVSIADYVSAGAECGEAGMNLAELELTDISRADSDPACDVTPDPQGCHLGGFLLGDPPNPLHLPRIRPGGIALRFWMLLAAMLSLDALAVYGAWELVGWVRGVLA